MKHGFSLIEVILYIALSTALLILLSSIFVWVVNSNLTSRTARDLEAEGLRVLQTMVNAIRNGHEINFPAVGNASSTLIIKNSSNALDITNFTLKDARIFVSEDGGSLIAITSRNVMAADLNFINVSKAGTTGAITVQFKISNRNQERKFYVSASLRRK